MRPDYSQFTVTKPRSSLIRDCEYDFLRYEWAAVSTADNSDLKATLTIMTGMFSLIAIIQQAKYSMPDGAWVKCKYTSYDPSWSTCRRQAKNDEFCQFRKNYVFWH